MRTFMLKCVSLLLVAVMALSFALVATAEEEQARNLFAELEIKDLNEQPFDASLFKGKPFMINIWATWCGPCTAEIPALEELHKEYGDRISIVGLLGDSVHVKDGKELVTNQQELEDAREMYQAMGVTYPSLIPNTFMLALMSELQVQYFPTTIFFDGNGRPVRMEVGGKDKAGWEAVIKEVLEKLETAN